MYHFLHVHPTKYLYYRFKNILIFVNIPFYFSFCKNIFLFIYGPFKYTISFFYHWLLSMFMLSTSHRSTGTDLKIVEANIAIEVQTQLIHLCVWISKYVHIKIDIHNISHYFEQLKLNILHITKTNFNINEY